MKPAIAGPMLGEHFLEARPLLARHKMGRPLYILGSIACVFGFHVECDKELKDKEWE